MRRTRRAWRRLTRASTWPDNKVDRWQCILPNHPPSVNCFPTVAVRLLKLLRSLGVWRDDLFPWGDDPFGLLIDRLSNAPRVLLVHGNDLNDAEIHCLQNHPNITVVYCPRTHDFFEYDKHPVDRMLAAGIPVALGTDSRASNPDLNLWREVQFLLQHRSDLAPDEVIRMATLERCRRSGPIGPGTNRSWLPRWVWYGCHAGVNDQRIVRGS